MPNPLEAKITDIGGNKVMVEIARQQVILDADHFPERTIKGKKVKVYFLDPDSSLSEKKIAKTILEEILNGK